MILNYCYKIRVFRCSTFSARKSFSYMWHRFAGELITYNRKSTNGGVQLILMFKQVQNIPAIHIWMFWVIVFVAADSRSWATEQYLYIFKDTIGNPYPRLVSSYDMERWLRPCQLFYEKSHRSFQVYVDGFISSDHCSSGHDIGRTYDTKFSHFYFSSKHPYFLY